MHKKIYFLLACLLFTFSLIGCNDSGKELPVATVTPSTGEQGNTEDTAEETTEETDEESTEEVSPDQLSTDTDGEPDEALFVLADGSLSMDLSTDWRVIDVDDTFLNNGYEKIAENNEKLAEILSDETLRTMAVSGYTLFAINLKADFLQYPNQPTLNIIEQDVTDADPITLQEFASTIESQLIQQVPLDSDIVQSAVEIDAGTAYRLEYSLSGTNSNGINVTAVNTQYIIEKAPNQFLLMTLSTPTELTDEYLQQFSEEVETIQLR